MKNNQINLEWKKVIIWNQIIINKFNYANFNIVNNQIRELKLYFMNLIPKIKYEITKNLYFV